MAIRNIRELSRYIRNTRSAIVKAHAEAMLKVTLDAEGLAKRNATQQFTGRNNYKLTGRLLNSIFSGFSPFNAGQSLPTGFIGTRGIPYGRIHEFGGVIEPVNAKHLWLKMHGVSGFKRITPKEFVSKMQKNPKQYRIFKSKKGNLIAAFINNKKKIKPLFVLRDKVTIPARPYLQPAVDEAVKKFPLVMRNRVAKNLLRVK